MPDPLDLGRIAAEPADPDKIAVTTGAPMPARDRLGR